MSNPPSSRSPYSTQPPVSRRGLGVTPGKAYTIWLESKQPGRTTEKRALAETSRKTTAIGIAKDAVEFIDHVTSERKKYAGLTVRAVVRDKNNKIAANTPWIAT